MSLLASLVINLSDLIIWAKETKIKPKKIVTFVSKTRWNLQKKLIRLFVKTNTGKNCSVVLNARMSFTVKITKKIPMEKAVINATQT
jgi:hypothetical protein